MPEGPAGGPRPGAEVFQSLEFGVFGSIPDDEAKRVGNKLKDIFGTDNYGTQTTPEIEGGVLVIPLNTSTVYRDNIETFLEEKEADTIADNLWSVTGRVEGKQGVIRPFANGKQRVTVNLTTVPSRAFNYEQLSQARIYDKLINDGWPPGANTPKFSSDDIESVDVDYEDFQVTVEVNQNKVDSDAINAIENRVRRLPKEVGDEIIEDILGGTIIEVGIEVVDKHRDELDSYQETARNIEVSQTVIEVV